MTIREIEPFAFGFKEADISGISPEYEREYRIACGIRRQCEETPISIDPKDWFVGPGCTYPNLGIHYSRGAGMASYPDLRNELQMIDRHGAESPLSDLGPVCTREDVIGACSAVREVRMSEPIREYIMRIVTQTRESPRVTLGVSPRGTLALVTASRTCAAADIALAQHGQSVRQQRVAHGVPAGFGEGSDRVLKKRYCRVLHCRSGGGVHRPDRPGQGL